MNQMWLKSGFSNVTKSPEIIAITKKVLRDLASNIIRSDPIGILSLIIIEKIIHRKFLYSLLVKTKEKIGINEPPF